LLTLVGRDQVSQFISSRPTRGSPTSTMVDPTRRSKIIAPFSVIWAREIAEIGAPITVGKILARRLDSC
jgi:hypothetical protein